MVFIDGKYFSGKKNTKFPFRKEEITWLKESIWAEFFILGEVKMNDLYGWGDVISKVWNTLQRQ